MTKVGKSRSGSIELHPVTQFQTLHGDAVVWDDLRFSLANTNIVLAATRYVNDLFNGGIQFDSDARYPNEPIYFMGQMPHSWKPESNIHPHIHWLQQSADVPNWLLIYRIINNGDPDKILTDYSFHTAAIIESHKYTYSAGTLAQISKFPVIDMTGFDMSCKLQLVLFRDTADTSGEFGGADPSALDEVVQELDIHFKLNSMGSSQEYEKDSA
ncbi:hypothetical protein HQ531_03575 [bacterium]|nr:hypothetical protein [bacterium]